MYQGILHAHSGLRWIVLILLIAAPIIAYLRLQRGAGFSESVRKVALFGLIGAHIQLLLGLILYFISPKVTFQAGFMSGKILRFYTLEHILIMIVAIALVTIGYSRSKKRDTEAGKLKAVAIFYGIALLLVLISIPWPFRGLGAGWF